MAVLLHTGWDRYWGDDEADAHPYLGEDAAAGFVARGATLVGTDALNVDATAGGTIHAHAALLAADVLIVENLTDLGALAAGRPFRCAFVPLRWPAATARRSARTRRRLSTDPDDFLEGVRRRIRLT